jgi:hypothetical protein
MVDYAYTDMYGETAPLPVYVDDEGTPAEDVTLIEKGVLVGYMNNRETAQHFGQSALGNARAYSFSDEPIIRMRNTAMLPGKSKVEDMITNLLTATGNQFATDLKYNDPGFSSSPETNGHVVLTLTDGTTRELFLAPRTGESVDAVVKTSSGLSPYVYQLSNYTLATIFKPVDDIKAAPATAAKK